METHVIYEIIGYVASVLVAVSLMMSKIVQLRIVNLIGAATFSLYGVLIGSIPVAGMNGFIVLINIYYLAKIYGSSEYFKILNVKTGSEYLNEFLNFYSKQIQEFQPDFEESPSESDLNIFVLRDMVPAGILIGNLKESGILDVKLDFVVPSYRDFKIGNFLFEQNADYFRDKGIQEVVTKPGNSKHNRYLEEMGFQMNQNGGGLYRLSL